jgi:hypothetical protein
MNPGQTLVVPIQVQALCVGNQDAQGNSFALTAMADFSGLPYVENGQQHNRKPYTSAEVVSRGGPFNGEITLPAGIHLHWALPAGLTHGQQQPDGSLMYPNVPNRWMVTRLILKNRSSSSATVVTKSWVVESDRLNLRAVSPDGMHQPSIPTDPGFTGQNFRFIGQAFEMESWAENPQAEHFNGLTATGYGEAAFASFYPNCSSVFGYFDNLTNSDYNYNYDSLAYQISGWYSDGTMDPAAPGISSDDNPFGWTFDNSTSDTVNNTMCSGIIDNIIWSSGMSYISNPNASLTVAVGPSSQEAVSALMAAQVESDPETAELILNALQFGLLSQAGTINGTIQNFEELVHESGFSNFNAGIVWQVRKKTQAGSDANYDGEVTLPEPLAQDLNALNTQQSELDELKETLASKRRQLFSDWYKYLMVEYATQHTPENIRDKGQAIREYLLEEAASINEMQLRVADGGELQQSIQTLADFITGMIDEQFELTNDVSAPRYWQANNPVLVLQGDDILPVNRTGNSATLRCRLTQDLLEFAAITANAVQSYQPQFATRFLHAAITFPNDSPQSLLNLLLNDAALLSNALQPATAAKLIQEYAQTYSGQYLNYTTTLGVLQTGLGQFLTQQSHPGTDYFTHTSTNAKAPDPLMVFSWNSTPWLPILMDYEVEFSPVTYLNTSENYPHNFITGNFVNDSDEIDLIYSGAAPSVSELYSGLITLSADSQVDLAESIRQFIQQTESTDEDLNKALTAVTDMPVLAQELSGLNHSLLMHKQLLQMKVADPLANTFDQMFVSAIRNAVGDESVYSPESNSSFNPIRSGALRIEKLRLIDVFGRFRDRDLSNTVLVAKSIQPPPQMNVAAGTAFLPPRITQPSRLLFRWLSADNDAIESNSHPASTPIIGWVLPDYPDRSVFLYNADGTPLGELAVNSTSNGVLWFAAPGGAFPLGTDMQTVMENQLPWLRNFATGLYNNGNPQLLISLINSWTLTAEQTMPAGSSNNTAGILIGQPLALTRANLELDLAGNAAVSQSWDAFANALVAGENTSDADFTKVEFPVQLGLSANFNDGLYTYWIQENTAIDFTKFYTSESTENALTLTSGKSGNNFKTVLMLVDPKADVHATTGILPVKSIAIPSDQYDAALNSLAVTFLTAPVLSGSNTSGLSIPLPQSDSGRWSWISVNNGEWQSQNFEDDIQNANQGALDYTPQLLQEGWLRLRDFEN